MTSGETWISAKKKCGVFIGELEVFAPIYAKFGSEMMATRPDISPDVRLLEFFQVLLQLRSANFMAAIGYVVSEPMNGCSTTRVFGSCMHTEGTLARPFKPAILRTDARGTVQKGFWLRRV